MLAKALKQLADGGARTVSAAIARREIELGRTLYPQEQIAVTLGVSQPTVSAWLLGWRRPSAEMRIRIESAHGIPADAWSTREERGARKKIAQRKAA